MDSRWPAADFKVEYIAPNEISPMNRDITGLRYQPGQPVSVVLCCHNKAAGLPQVISALARGIVRPDLVVLSDDRSTDERSIELAVRDVVPILTRDFPAKAGRPLESRLDLARLAGTFGTRCQAGNKRYPASWTSLPPRQTENILEARLVYRGRLSGDKIACSGNPEVPWYRRSRLANDRSGTAQATARDR